MKKFVFIGDSITDADRDKSSEVSLGNGYVSTLQESHFSATGPMLNKGMNGNKVNDVLMRIEVDCIAQHPDVVTLLVGVNDTLHRFKYHNSTPLGDFQRAYEKLLNALLESEIATIILMEPFLLPVALDCGAPSFVSDASMWKEICEDLDEKRAVIRKIAGDASIPIVLLDACFKEASKTAAPENLLYDGIHPTPQGYHLIAREWMKVYGMNTNIPEV